jgi:UDP-glucuronate decarboxylase
LVTGGAGFLGSHLCERLIAQGHDVICVDNFYTGTKQNISQLLGHPRFELARHDITFPIYLEVDEIYNLACPASPIHYQYDPVQTTKVNVHGSINMLGLAKRVKAKILQASTSEVLRRSQHSSSARELLRNGESDWAQGLLRRRQTLRRNAVF